MAEVFGAFAGALSVAALFNNCVECFEYIQLARHFGQDFERQQLKLDVLKARLSRWGEAAAVNQSPEFNNQASRDESAQLAHRLLEGIMATFEEVQKTSNGYNMDSNKQDAGHMGDQDRDMVRLRLHERFTALVRQRKKQTSLTKKIAWSLSDRNRLEYLVSKVSDLVGDLENLFPVGAGRRELISLEIQEIDDEPSLLALQEAASSTDKLLSDTVAEKVKQVAEQNRASFVSTEDNARVRVGTEWSEAALARGTAIVGGTTNSVDSLAGKGQSRVHIGSSHGGKSIFDD